ATEVRESFEAARAEAAVILHRVGPVGKSRAKENLFLIWASGGVRNGEHKMRSTIRWICSGRVLKEIGLAVSIRVGAGAGVWIILAKVLDLPAIIHSVSGVDAIIIVADVQHNQIDRRKSALIFATNCYGAILVHKTGSRQST